MAKTYKYVDKNGVVVFTDEYNSIPDEYKKSAVVVKEDSEKNTLPPAPARVDAAGRVYNPTSVPAPMEETPFKEKVTKFFTDPFVHKLSVVFFLFLLFIFAGRLLKGFENKKIVTLLRFGIMVVIGVILFQSYLEKAEKQYEALKQDAEQLKMKAIKRGLKADEIVR